MDVDSAKFYMIIIGFDPYRNSLPTQPLFHATCHHCDALRGGARDRLRTGGLNGSNEIWYNNVECRKGYNNIFRLFWHHVVWPGMMWCFFSENGALSPKWQSWKIFFEWWGNFSEKSLGSGARILFHKDLQIHTMIEVDQSGEESWLVMVIAVKKTWSWRCW